MYCTVQKTGMQKFAIHKVFLTSDHLYLIYLATVHWYILYLSFANPPLF